MECKASSGNKDENMKVGEKNNRCRRVINTSHEGTALHAITCKIHVVEQMFKKIIIKLNNRNNQDRQRERVPWQMKISAFGEERGNHLHVKSSIPLAFLMYACC